MGEGQEASWVLAIDSLAPRLEGLLRDRCQRQGIATVRTKSEGSALVTREREINELLRDPEVEAMLGEDNTLFLRAVLAEQSGFNLRNKVAHALMLPGEYNLFSTHWLLVGVLRLGAV